MVKNKIDYVSIIIVLVFCLLVVLAYNVFADQSIPGTLYVQNNTVIKGSYCFGNSTVKTCYSSFDNSSWNESRANALYYLLTNPSRYLNTSNASYILSVANTSGDIKNWNESGYIINWNASGYIKNWNDSGLIINQTVGLISYNTSWDESRADLLYVPYTGATGNVNLGANNLTVNTNVLHVDATNSRVGIGTTNPAVLLHVSDYTSSLHSSLITAMATYQGVFVKNNGISAVGNLISSNTASDRGITVFLKTRGTPAVPLVVQNNDYLGDLLFGGYDGNSAEYGGGVFAFVDGTPTEGSVPVRISFVTGNNSATRTERLTVKSSGNIGIGTTSPVQKLDVNDSVNITANVYVGGNITLGGVNLVSDNTTWNESRAGALYVPYSGANQKVYLNNQSLEIQNTKGANVTLNNFVEHTQEMMTDTLLDKSRSILSVVGSELNYTLVAFYGCGQFNFNGTLYPVSGSPCVPNATVTLLCGTNTTPKTNYVHWYLVGDTPTLTTTEAYPSYDHIDVATFVVGNCSDNYATIYAYNRNRYEVDTFVKRSIERWEESGTLYISGLTPNASTNNLTVLTGEFFNGIFEMMTTNNVSVDKGFYYVNSSGNFVQATSLSAITQYANGVVFSGGPNERVNVVWGIVPINITGGVGPTQARLVAVLSNEPSVKYNTVNEAIADNYETTNYFPSNSEVKNVFVPIARTILRPSTSVFEPFSSGNYFKDIRGLTTNNGGASSPPITSHAALTSLDYASSGHTGFASITEVATQNDTVARIGSCPFDSLVQNITTSGVNCFNVSVNSTNGAKGSGTVIPVINVQNGRIINITTATATGDISSIVTAATSGLQGGATTGTVTLILNATYMDYNYVTNTSLKNNMSLKVNTSNDWVIDYTAKSWNWGYWDLININQIQAVSFNVTNRIVNNGSVVVIDPAYGNRWVLNATQNLSGYNNAGIETVNLDALNGNILVSTDVCIGSGNCLSNVSTSAGNTSWNESYAFTLFPSITSLNDNITAVRTDITNNATATLISAYANDSWGNGRFNATSWNKTGTSVVLASTTDYVGIGNSAPGQMLQVGRGTVAAPAINGIIRVGATNGASAYREWDFGVNISAPISYNFFIKDTLNSSPAMVIQYGNQFVGLGTSSPNQRLTVNGSVNISTSGSALYFSDGSSMITAYNTSWNETLANGLYLLVGDQRYNDTASLMSINNISNSSILSLVSNNLGNFTAARTNIAFINQSNTFTENQTVDSIIFEKDSSHIITDNSSCIIINGDTTMLEVC